MLLFYAPLIRPSEPAKIKKGRNENLEHFLKIDKNLAHDPSLESSTPGSRSWLTTISLVTRYYVTIDSRSWLKKQV